MARLPAKTIQKLLKAKDRQIIAYGYEPLMDDRPRLTLCVWFEGGKLYRAGWSYNKPPSEVYVSDTFHPNFFTMLVKRWYKNGLLPGLVDWFETFGTTLSTTDGGGPPEEPPDISHLTPKTLEW